MASGNAENWAWTRSRRIEAAPVLAQRVGSVQVAPHPRGVVVVKHGTSYTVPAGRILVIAALGGRIAASNVKVSLTVNGVTEIDAMTEATVGNGVSLKTLSSLLVFPAGSLVEVSDNFGLDYGRAWGYLVDE